MIVDAERIVQWANAAFARVLGVPGDALVGRDLFEVIHDDDLPELIDTISTLTRTPGASGTATFRMKSSDGSWRRLETSARNLLQDPALRGFVISLRDVTDRVTAEAALTRAKRATATWSSTLATPSTRPIWTDSSPRPTPRQSGSPGSPSPSCSR